MTKQQIISKDDVSFDMDKEENQLSNDGEVHLGNVFDSLENHIEEADFVKGARDNDKAVIEVEDNSEITGNAEMPSDSFTPLTCDNKIACEANVICRKFPSLLDIKIKDI